jgi:hypothetical protein
VACEVGCAGAAKLLSGHRGRRTQLHRLTMHQVRTASPCIQVPGRVRWGRPLASVGVGVVKWGRRCSEVGEEWGAGAWAGAWASGESCA